MEVFIDNEPEGSPEVGKRKRKKSRRPMAKRALPPEQAAQAAAADLCRREEKWLARLAADPSTFAEVELEVHERARRHADQFVAGLLAKASERPEMAPKVEATLASAEAPLRPVEKKDAL